MQLLPDASDEFAELLEKNVLAMPSLSGLFKESKGPEQVLGLLFKDMDYKINEKVDVAFQCICSKDKYQIILGTLQNDDLEEMIKKDHGAEAVCSFCNSRFQFNEEELRNVLEEKKRGLS